MTPHIEGKVVDREERGPDNRRAKPDSEGQQTQRTKIAGKRAYIAVFETQTEWLQKLC